MTPTSALPYIKQSVAEKIYTFNYATSPLEQLGSTCGGKGR